MDFSKIKGIDRMKKFDKLIKAVKKTTVAKEKNDFKDNDIYYPERDSEGNAKVVIRFLPGLEAEGEPCFVELFTHGFKSPNGRWFIENCPTTIEGKCPVCQANSALVQSEGGWNVMTKSSKSLVRERKRKQGFFTNIIVISDKVNPENEGKVFKFRFGFKILEKIMAKMTPEFDDVEPINVFDYNEGANFRLVIRKVEGYANYDKSEFDAPTTMDDKTIALVKEKQFTLNTYTDPDNFMDYDKMVEKYNSMYSTSSNTGANTAAESFASNPVTNDMDKTTKKVDEAKKAEVVDDDDNLDYFRKLAEEVA